MVHHTAFHIPHTNIEKGKNIGLSVIEDKTKYLIVSRRQHRQNSLAVEDMTFEKVSKLKYLGLNVNERNSHEGINRRIIEGNKCYLSVYKRPRSYLLYYMHVAWASTKADERRLMIFERKILRRIYGPKKNTENNEYEKRTNAELKELLNETDIVGRRSKSRKFRWAGHVW